MTQQQQIIWPYPTFLAGRFQRHPDRTSTEQWNEEKGEKGSELIIDNPGRADLANEELPVPRDGSCGRLPKDSG
jgi:hypothetical protein